eukprot:g11241.t1
MSFFQFTFGLTLTAEETKDGHVTRGVGGGIKMDENRKIRLVGVCRVQILHKLVPESAFGLPDIEDTIRSYTGPKPHLFLRYIDDCIGAASCSHEE